MNVVDSSAWLEYFADSPNAENFASAIENERDLIVPSICLLEVFKKVLREAGLTHALEKIAHMKQGKIVPLDDSLALDAAQLGVELGLPLADSIILATAKRFEALLWTQDDDFKGIAGVRYFPKKA